VAPSTVGTLSARPASDKPVVHLVIPPAVLPLSATVLGRVTGKLASLVLHALDPACAPCRIWGSDGGRDAKFTNNRDKPL